MKIFVGNLAFSTTDSDLRNAFAKFGQVDSASVIMDRATGQSRGFGFVEMPDGPAAEAIQQLDGTELGGRRLKVNKATPKTDRGPGGGGGDRGGDRGYRPRY